LFSRIIQSAPGGKFSILEGHSVCHSKQKKNCICTSVLFRKVSEMELFQCTVPKLLLRKICYVLFTYTSYVSFKKVNPKKNVVLRRSLRCVHMWVVLVCCHGNKGISAPALTDFCRWARPPECCLAVPLGPCYSPYTPLRASVRSLVHCDELKCERCRAPFIYISLPAHRSA
jgi:hypothetical protein